MEAVKKFEKDITYLYVSRLNYKCFRQFEDRSWLLLGPFEELTNIVSQLITRKQTQKLIISLAYSLPEQESQKLITLLENKFKDFHNMSQFYFQTMYHQYWLAQKPLDPKPTTILVKFGGSYVTIFTPSKNINNNNNNNNIDNTLRVFHYNLIRYEKSYHSKFKRYLYKDFSTFHIQNKKTGNDNDKIAFIETFNNWRSKQLEKILLLLKLNADTLASTSETLIVLTGGAALYFYLQMRELLPMGNISIDYMIYGIEFTEPYKRLLFDTDTTTKGKQIEIIIDNQIVDEPQSNSVDSILPQERTTTTTTTTTPLPRQLFFAREDNLFAHQLILDKPFKIFMCLIYEYVEIDIYTIKIKGNVSRVPLSSLAPVNKFRIFTTFTAQYKEAFDKFLLEKNKKTPKKEMDYFKPSYGFNSINESAPHPYVELKAVLSMEGVFGLEPIQNISKIEVTQTHANTINLY